LFISTWTAKEELLLLENLIKLRYGNWILISEAMGGSKTPEECELHYKQVYLNKAINDIKKYAVVSFRDTDGYIKERWVSNNEQFNTFDTMQIDGYHYGVNERKNEADKGILNEFAGYMPMRKDFDIEYENDIENFLGDLEFYDDDRPEDIEIKLKQLKIYQKVLDEREERKDFVMSRWPQEVRIEKKLKNSIFEKNAYATARPFARYFVTDKHSSFCEAIARENMLKMKLDELKEARAKGIKTEEEFKKFLLQKKSLYANKSKEYDLLYKETFAYKQAESQKFSILNDLESQKVRDPKEEEDICRNAGISLEQFSAFKDKIVANMESKSNSAGDDRIDEGVKKEFIDFIVKMK
jgi:transcriptional adapter 2-alpha